MYYEYESIQMKVQQQRKIEREINMMISKLLFVFCINCRNCYTIYHTNFFHNNLNAIIYKTEYINNYYMR